MARQQRTYEYRGRQYSIAELTQLAQRRFHNPIKATQLARRINQMGWSTLRAMKTPIHDRADLSGWTEQQKRQRLSDQQNAYYKRNRKTFYRSQYLSVGKKYITEYANVEELQDVLQMIKRRRRVIKRRETRRAEKTGEK